MQGVRPRPAGWARGWLACSKRSRGNATGSRDSGAWTSATSGAPLSPRPTTCEARGSSLGAVAPPRPRVIFSAPRATLTSPCWLAHTTASCTSCSMRALPALDALADPAAAAAAAGVGGWAARRRGGAALPQGWDRRGSRRWVPALRPSMPPGHDRGSATPCWIAAAVLQLFSLRGRSDRSIRAAGCCGNTRSRHCSHNECRGDGIEQTSLNYSLPGTWPSKDYPSCAAGALQCLPVQQSKMLQAPALLKLWPAASTAARVLAGASQGALKSSWSQVSVVCMLARPMARARGRGNDILAPVRRGLPRRGATAPSPRWRSVGE